jgi:DNA helicase IV
MNETWWVKQQDLDDRQKAVIDLPLNQSHLIVGPPGSGKTNLLLLRGSQLVRSGKPNVLILVFTRTLREFVASGSHLYAFGDDRIKTLNSWTFELLRDEGVKPAQEKDFVEQRQQRIAQIADLIASRKVGRLFDAIIIDEAQDYLPEEIDAFLKLAEVVFAAADSRQRIYATEDVWETLLRTFPEPFILKHHYRNGHKICSVADALAKKWCDLEPLMPTNNYDEGKNPSSVTITRTENVEEQVDKALVELRTQMKAYPDEYLGVLCPTRASLKSVWSFIKGSPLAGKAVLQSAEEGYVPFEADKPICVCSIHGAKGLEFRAVHILQAEHMKKSPLNRNIAYTAVTRAKTSLSIYHSNPIPAYLDSALMSVRDPVMRAGLEQLFRTT